MSNPNIAPRHPLTEKQMALSLFAADAYYDAPEGAESERIKVNGKDLHYLQARLGRFNTQVAVTIVVPKGQTVDAWVLSKKMPAPYSVDQGKSLTLRKRTKQGKDLQLAALMELPTVVPPGWEFLLRSVCVARAQVTVYADGGPVHTLGRLTKYYPVAFKGRPVLMRRVARSTAPGLSSPRAWT